MVDVSLWDTRSTLFPSSSALVRHLLNLTNMSQLEDFMRTWAADPNRSLFRNSSDGNHEDAPLIPLPWWQQVIFYVMFVLLFVVAAGGNVVVIWIVLAHKRMRTVTNYFLVNLAIADVLVSIFNVLFHFTLNLYQDWMFGLEYCKFSFFIAPCTISVSVLTFMAIAVDRYIAIIHPLRPRLTGRIVLSIITIIWVVSCLLALPNLLYATVFHYPSRTLCYLRWPDATMDQISAQDLAYSILLMVLNYFLPMFTLFGTYARISYELWGSQVIGEAVPMQTERVRGKRKVVKMMIAVVVIFGLCWLPTHVYFILTNVHKTIVYWPYIQQVYILIYWLAMSNSMYNPIIYCLMNARFRQGFLRFFRWCPCPPCRRNQHLLVIERGFYSTRMSLGSDRGDRNGSLLHTTMESIDDHLSTPSASMYRMHAMAGKSRGYCYVPQQHHQSHQTHHYHQQQQQMCLRDNYHSSSSSRTGDSGTATSALTDLCPGD